MSKFDLERLLNDRGIQHKKNEYQHQGKSCIRYELAACFFDESHVKNDACFFEYENGSIAYK